MHNKAPRRPKLVVFDCDGTLVDSQHVIISAMQTAFASCDLPPPDSDRVRAIIGLSLENAVLALAPSQEASQLEALVENYKKAFVTQRQAADFHEPLFDGARQLLATLAAAPDVLLGVATGKSRRGVDVLFERENLHDYFHTIKTADDAPSKPHPGMIELAMDETGVERPHVMMIGDTSFDIEMARSAGVKSVGVRWGYHAESRLLQAGADNMVSSFHEIAELVVAMDLSELRQ